VNNFPVDCQSTLKLLINLLGWQASTIPQKPLRTSSGGSFAQWIKEIREINSQVGDFGERAIRAAVNKSSEITVSHPGAIIWAIGGEVGKLAKQQIEEEQKTSRSIDTPFTRALEEQSPAPRKTFGQILAERKQSEQLNNHDNAA
jgi:hypothetical protein